MYEYKVDPVRYAWERCNVGVSFPGVLGTRAGPTISAPGVWSPWRQAMLVHAASGVDTIRRAFHSLIVGRRPPRPESVS